jgi:hypothetical protein
MASDVAVPAKCWTFTRPGSTTTRLEVLQSVAVSWNSGTRNRASTKSLAHLTLVMRGMAMSTAIRRVR